MAQFAHIQKPQKIDERIHHFNDNIEKIQLWEDSKIWKLEGEEYYSEWFLNEVNSIKEKLISCVKNGFPSKIENEKEYSFFKNLVYYLSETENIKEALVKVNGWLGRIGLEIAKGQMRSFYAVNGKIPQKTDDGMVGIKNSCTRGYWKDFGYSTWNDLLQDVIGEVNHPQNAYKGKKALDDAEKALLNFYQKNNRLPTMNDFPEIASACNRGAWVEFQVEKWNDVLRTVFGRVNKDQVIFRDGAGLALAKNILIAHYLKNNELPRAKDFPSIFAACQDGYWITFGVRTWNHLMMDVFGKINSHPGIHLGLDGLNRARQILKEISKRNNRLPTCKDSGIGSIYAAACDGYWEEFGIKSWNDLLMDVFGKINVEMGIYVGIEGFELAKNRLLEFYEKNERKPKSSEVNGIAGACSKGYWRNQGIFKWNDLLRAVFNEVNLDFGKYDGKQGFDLAKQEVLSFYQKYNRKPTLQDDQFQSIRRAIAAGKWPEIKSWNAFLKEIFNSVNIEMNFYLGEQGLERAKKKLLEFKEKYGRIPFAHNFNSICCYCSRGYWNDQGIQCWNDLVKMVFGTCNKPMNIYKGLEGLERTKQAILEFFEREGRYPSGKDKGFGGIYDACLKGNWKSVSIDSWSRLIDYCTQSKAKR